MNNFQYAPGLKKLIHHQEHLSKIEKREIVGPIHLSVFPNNFCQLNCEYCCFSKTQRNSDELSLSDFKIAIDTLKKYGLKATEISGGGDSLLWSNFDQAIEYAYSKNLKLSLVTNGLLLDSKSKDILEKFNWIRISVQSTEYAKKINMNHIPSNVKTSMSYIVYNKKSLSEIGKLYQFSKDKNIIIRVAPIRPCDKLWEQKVQKKVEQYGHPLIFFNKEFGTPLGCYMIYLRAALDWNGNFLPCPSIELSPEHAGKIPEDFGVCKVSEIENWLSTNRPHDLGYQCSFCNCGKNSNDYIHDLLEKMEDVNFV
jgi:organic radical activating enzyme